MEHIKKGHLPQVKGLILAGGRSTRMGQDKGLIEWHGRPQREYLADMLQTRGIETCISCRPDQAPEMSSRPLLLDRYSDLGPLGAVASAFSENPTAAWLVVACDMPLLDAGTILHLLEMRRPDFAGTAFRSPAFPDGSPDSLLAIWVPKVVPVLHKYLLDGNYSARHVLMTAGVFLLDAPDPTVLTNVNNPSEVTWAKHYLTEFIHSDT